MGGTADLVYALRMIYRFGPFELDLAKIELRSEGNPRSLEPQVYALLVLLVENRHRLVSRDEILEKVWNGRSVSEAAIASRVKSVRKSLGDDGRSQRYVRTIHGKGLRFVAEVSISTGTTVHEHLAAGAGSPEPGTAATPIPFTDASSSQPSIAVLPFEVLGGDGPHAALAYALPHDLITELSTLRWLIVTARGSSFRQDICGAGYAEISRLLGVRYCLFGTVDVAGRRLTVAAELIDGRDGRVVWADSFRGSLDDIQTMRNEIRSGVLVALEIRIPLHEAALARHCGTEHIDAWSAYHVGLQHMYRFTRSGNAAATALFGRAVELDPGFARAYAGLSFVHFQTAFLHHTDNVVAEAALARSHAERAVMLDPLDPFVNFAMGRTYWLQGELESSLAWLERATAISPNYAQAIYALAWTEAMAGRAENGRNHIDLAMRLSPLDPLHYAMLATRAFTHVALGEDSTAAEWAERAARAPDAHVMIAMIAAAAHRLAGNRAAAVRWAANVRECNAALVTADFLRSFPMQREPMRGRMQRALSKLGF